MLVLAPQFSPETIFDETTLPKVTAYCGEFSALPHVAEWPVAGRCEILPGVGDFLGNWVERILDIPEPPIPDLEWNTTL